MRRRVTRRAYFTPPAERTNAAGADKFVVENIADEMAAFDRLPKRIQRWLDEGPRKYSAVQIEELIKNGEAIKTPGFADEEPTFLPAKRGFRKVSFIKW